MICFRNGRTTWTDWNSIFQQQMWLEKYRELEDAAADAKDADTYKNMLDQSYAKGEINLREYRELWDRFARQMAEGK